MKLPNDLLQLEVTNSKLFSITVNMTYGTATLQIPLFAWNCQLPCYHTIDTIYTVSQKSPTYTTCYNFYIHSSIATIFTARRNARIASAALAIAIPSVCLSVRPSVCLSHDGIVSTRQHVARCSLHCQIAKCV